MTLERLGSGDVMLWKKVPAAADEWAGGLSLKTLYAAIRTGRLKAARIGAGRNVLVCEAFIDEWLNRSSRLEPHKCDSLMLVRPHELGRRECGP